jgi:hypothetical protein
MEVICPSETSLTFNRLHGVIFHKIVLLISTAVRISTLHDNNPVLKKWQHMKGGCVANISEKFTAYTFRIERENRM